MSFCAEHLLLSDGLSNILARRRRPLSISPFGLSPGTASLAENGRLTSGTGMDKAATVGDYSKRHLSNRFKNQKSYTHWWCVYC